MSNNGASRHVQGRCKAFVSGSNVRAVMVRIGGKNQPEQLVLRLHLCVSNSMFPLSTGGRVVGVSHASTVMHTPVFSGLSA